MADESDVETALVGLSSVALYPNGINSPSIPGPDCRIYRGWPNSAALDADLAAGSINVTIFPVTGHARTTTRYTQLRPGNPTSPTLTVSVSGASVTFGGSAALGQVAGIFLDGPTGPSYVYRTQTCDNPALVAANLAALTRATALVQLSGSTLTIPGVRRLVARVVADGHALQEIRRQEQDFRVTCWCPTPASRDAAAVAIDVALAQLRFITLPDGSMGKLTYAGTRVFDQSQDASLYRRDLLYQVDYPTIIIASQPAMLFGDLLLNTANFTA
jgi:hypothetical protein